MHKWLGLLVVSLLFAQHATAQDKLKPENAALVGKWQGVAKDGTQTTVDIKAEGDRLAIELVIIDAKGNRVQTGKATDVKAIGGFFRTDVDVDPPPPRPLKVQAKIVDGKLQLGTTQGFDRKQIDLAKVGADGEVARDPVAKSGNDNPDFVELASFPGPSPLLRGMPAALSPDGKLLALAAGDVRHQVLIVDLESKKERRLNLVGPVCAVCWSGDGKKLLAASATKDSLLEVGEGRQVALWDASSWEQTALFEHPHHPVSVALSHDASVVAAASFVNSGQVGNLLVWDVKKKQELLSKRVPFALTNFALSPKGDVLAASSGGGEPKIVLFDLPSGKERAGTWKIEDGLALLRMTPDGRGLAGVAGNGKLFLWELQSRRQLKSFGSFPGRPHGATLLAGAKYTAVGGSSADVQIFDNRSGDVVHKFSPCDKGCYYLAASADGSRLVTYGQDKIIRVWQTPLEK